MTTEQLPDEWWNTFYAEHDQIWSGKPNSVLVDEVSELTPGRALDLGCGEGADAIWLAQQGWAVTAVDISTVALGRAEQHAKDAGVGDRIDWQRHELGKSFPDGEFDLVSAQFLHSKTELDRDAILRRAAGAVARGGVLLIEGHMGFPSNEHSPSSEHQHGEHSSSSEHQHGEHSRSGEHSPSSEHQHGEHSPSSKHQHSEHSPSGEHQAHNPHPDIHFPTPDEVVQGLALADGEWEVLVSEVHDRAQVMRDGVLINRRDSTVKVRRR